MNIELEDRLERDLHLLAERSPASLHGLAAIERRVRQRQRRRRGSLMAGVAVVGVAGLAALVTAGRSNGDQSPGHSGFVPAGREVPLAITSEAPPALPLVKPGSLVSIRYPGRPALHLYITVAFYEGHAVQEQCLVSEEDGGGCTPFVDRIPQSLGISSTADNSGASRDLWTWTGLPGEVAYVSFTDGGHEQVWQRPVAGVVAFEVDGPSGARRGIAYDTEGNVVGRSDEIDPATFPQFLPFDWSRLSAEQKDGLWTVIDSSMRACLNASGNEAWEPCVDVTDQTMSDWLTSNAP